VYKLNFEVPPYRISFRGNHSTAQQCQRIINKIRNSLEAKKFCALVLLDVQQAFDKVWYEGIIQAEIKFAYELYLVLKWYLEERHFHVKIDDTLSVYHLIEARVPEGSVLGPLPYLIYTADAPTTNNTLIATFADDTAILSSDVDPARASERLQYLNLLQNWLTTWKIKKTPIRSIQITFTTRRALCPQVNINNVPIPIKTEVKYLSLHLDQKLTWRAHTKAKRRQLELKLKDMYWLMNKESKLSVENKLTIYKIIFKPVSAYGVEL
jgi:hypothetical protein